MRLYINKTINLCKIYLPTYGAMRSENMPGYHAPRVRSELTTEVTTISANLASGEPVDQIISPLLTSVMINVFGGHKFFLQTVPILTGFLFEAEQPKITRLQCMRLMSFLIRLTYMYFIVGTSHLLIPRRHFRLQLQPTLANVDDPSSSRSPCALSFRTQWMICFLSLMPHLPSP